MNAKKAEVSLGTNVTELEVTIGIDEAKAILGWREPKQGEKGIRVPGPEGTEEVVLANNTSNRPLSMGLAKQYAEQMFRQEWAGQKNSPAKTSNGEAFVIDKKGHIVSCAHRCLGLVLAEYRRQRLVKIDQKDLLKELKITGPITIKTVVLAGVDGAAADTNDTGKNRSLGDVFFRRSEMNGQDINETTKKTLSRELAVAVRLVWLRINGQRVSRGGKLHTPEAVAFLERHPLLHDALLHVWNEDGGKGAEGKKISNYISLGYAAGLLYLAAYGNSNRDKYEAGELDMTRKPKGWSKAEEFWTLFAQDLHTQDNPIKGLHKLLEKNRQSEKKLERDALCVLVTRAYLAWMEVTEKWQTTRALGSKLYEKDGDRELLVFERFGGLDLDRQTLRDAGYLEEEEAARLSVADWKVGDTGWVDQEDGVDPWFGKIVAFSDDGSHALMEEAGTEDQYTVEVKWLHINQPEREEEEAEVEAEVAEEVE